MITSKYFQGLIVGVFSTVVFVLFVASSTLQSDPNLERRVTSLEERVTKLEQSSSIGLESRPSNSKPANNWRRLENGMSMSQVRNLLGEPDRVSNSGRIVFWYYGTGSINFRENRVDGWREPY